MSDRLEKITQQRLDKLQRLRARGINPYPNSYHRTHTIGEAIALFEQAKAISTLRLTGRIVAHRNMGKVTFVDLQDGSGKIQAYFRSNEVGEEKYELVRDFDIGDFIGASGELFKTKSGETTLRVSDFAMLAKSLQPLPEKWHGLVDVEKRYRQRYLDLLSNQETKPVFIRRSQIISALRNFLNKQGFLEVETPVLQPMAGGAMARPFLSHHPALLPDLY